jgi:hypothetical protein
LSHCITIPAGSLVTPSPRFKNRGHPPQACNDRSHSLVLPLSDFASFADSSPSKESTKHSPWHRQQVRSSRPPLVYRRFRSGSIPLPRQVGHRRLCIGLGGVMKLRGPHRSGASGVQISSERSPDRWDLFHDPTISKSVTRFQIPSQSTQGRISNGDTTGRSSAPDDEWPAPRRTPGLPRQGRRLLRCRRTGCGRNARATGVLDRRAWGRQRLARCRVRPQRG